jgi:hypothetical protein
LTTCVCGNVHLLMAPSYALAYTFECGNVARRWRPERETPSTPGYHFNLSFVFIKPDHCIRVLFRQRKRTAVCVCVCGCVRFSSPLSTPGHTELQHKGGHRRNNHRPGKRLLSGTKESARSFAGFSANTHKQHSSLRGAFYTHLTQKGAQREFWCGGLRRLSQNHFGRGAFDERSVLNPFKQICFNEEMNLS